jgi:hypothetical protein
MHVRASKKNHGAQANFQNAYCLFFHLLTEGRFLKFLQHLAKFLITFFRRHGRGICGWLLAHKMALNKRV